MSGAMRGPGTGISAPANGFGYRHLPASNHPRPLGGSDVSGAMRGPGTGISAPANGFGCRHLIAPSHLQPRGGSNVSHMNQKRNTP